MIEMLGIPGLGPKRIKLMHEELGVDSIAASKKPLNKAELHQ